MPEINNYYEQVEKKYIQILKNHYGLIALVFFSVLYIAFFSVAKQAIDKGEKPITEKPKNQNSEEQNKEAKVILNIEYLGKTRAFSAALNTRDSIGDLFEYLRSKNLIQYESKAYSDGTKIVELDNVSNTDKNKWYLYQKNTENEQEIPDYSSVKLTNNGTYILRYK